ncbi:MMPL family transporter, partial [Streptomyces phaeofaciens]|uniref:MMPL family transporter n=1 Tax=Streptomyces phaeofaciens TaxID=68254 RepID=UPI00227D70BD
RHREYLARGLDPREAAGRAVATAGRPVVFAGGTVVVSILGMAVANVPCMTVGGLVVSIVVLTGCRPVRAGPGAGQRVVDSGCGAV